MIRVELKGVDKLERELGRDARRKLNRILRRLTTKWARDLKVQVIRGRYFDRPKPELQTPRGVWARGAKREGGKWVAKAGWAVPYGHALEHGRKLGPQTHHARVLGWVVERTRSVLLDYVAHKRIKPHMAYRRKSSWTVNVKSKSQRPHWSVAINRLSPRFQTELRQALNTAGL